MNRVNMRLLIICALLTFAACKAGDGNNANNTNTARPTPPRVAPAGDGVRRVTTAELEELVKQDKAVVVDVRNKDAYDRGHIPGARWIPVTEVAQRFNELPRDKTIVTYCS